MVRPGDLPTPGKASEEGSGLGPDGPVWTASSVNGLVPVSSSLPPVGTRSSEPTSEPMRDPTLESVVQQIHRSQAHRHRALQPRFEPEHHLEQGVVPQAERAPQPARLSLLLRREGPALLVGVVDPPVPVSPRPSSSVRRRSGGRSRREGGDGVVPMEYRSR